MNATIYFVTGVCGVGKSSIIPQLKLRLSSDPFDIHDFDERGVPDSATRAWRIAETQRWIEEGAAKAQKGISTVVCGFANPEELPQIKKKEDLRLKYILLDADEKTIRDRLVGRYATAASGAEIQRVTGDSVESFIQNNVSFLSALREICRAKGCDIVDTRDQKVDVVANHVADHLLKDAKDAVAAVTLDLPSPDFREERRP
jgi:hypothetical protein